MTTDSLTFTISISLVLNHNEMYIVIIVPDAIDLYIPLWEIEDVVCTVGLYQYSHDISKQYSLHMLGI